MLRVTINGQACTFAEGASVLDALRHLHIAVPTLCHDDRLAPCGACRLCIVEIKGWSRPATACTTVLADGMEILTHPPAIEDARRTLLRLLAETYPVETSLALRTKEFHRYVDQYNAWPRKSDRPLHLPAKRVLPDASHPYIQVDMARCVTCFRCVRICDEVQGQNVWQVWNRGDATTFMPDSGTTLRESSCVSCGACVDTCPSGALEDKTLLERGVPTVWTRTTCPYCGVGCEMNVGTRDDCIVQIKPAADSPVNRGHLCSKGRYAFDYVRSPERVTDPLIRDGRHWRRASWPEAIAFTADNLRRILARDGPGSIGMLGSARATNEENYLTQKFARVVLGTNNVDCCARVCHAPTASAMAAMLGTGAATNSFADIEQARAFLLCGANATENHPIVGARIKQAVLRGARLIVIDPRAIELARYAQVHLALRPGTNVALLNALACTIVEEALFDPDAVRDGLDGWEAFQAFVRNFAPERVAEICGVAPALIREAARLYATTKPAMCFHGLGVTEQVDGTDGVKALVNLALLTGNLGRPGSGVNPLRGQNNVQGAAHMGCEPHHLPGYIPVAAGRERFQLAWRAPVPAAPGLDLMEMIDAAGAGRLRALWAIGYDVALTNPNAAATLDSLRSLEFVVVQDLFLTELARACGSVFFPAAASFEKDGTFMNAERRVQRVRRALAPPGQARADWEILCELARAFGRPEGFAFQSAGEIWDELRQLWPAGRGITYQRLEAGGLQWPCPTEAHPGTAILHTDAASPSRSQHRRTLQCIGFEPSAERVSTEYPYLLMTGRTLQAFNAGTMTGHTPHATLRPADTLDLSPADAASLRVTDADSVRVRSRYGAATLPVRIVSGLPPGRLFATFHTPSAFVNRVTGPARDASTHTPAYKLTAVALEKTPEKASPRQVSPGESQEMHGGEPPTAAESR